MHRYSVTILLAAALAACASPGTTNSSAAGNVYADPTYPSPGVHVGAGVGVQGGRRGAGVGFGIGF